ncbi:cupin domain-containing protein [Ancylobacter sp.]|uniref:cupin domain-containing protein n=1 Tax=Ancylobacter sp. TaxID=1872567 RepID=UPI003BABA0BF
MPHIGPGIRELRRRRNLGIRRLALRSGVSHSSISLIERDRISPSIDTLAAILEALGTTLVGFFSELQQMSSYSPFYEASELPEVGSGEAISYRVIGINHPNRQILVLHETYAVGADTGEAFSHTAQEAGMVIRGAVEVTVESNSKVLRVGDAYYFDSKLPHRFRNVADEPSEIVSAINPPTY